MFSLVPVCLAVVAYQALIGDLFWIACESDSAELPAFFRLKEISIRSANVSTRRGAGTAAQDVLIAHELAIVFAKRARLGPITGIR